MICIIFLSNLFFHNGVEHIISWGWTISIELTYDDVYIAIENAMRGRGGEYSFTIGSDINNLGKLFIFARC